MRYEPTFQNARSQRPYVTAGQHRLPPLYVSTEPVGQHGLLVRVTGEIDLATVSPLRGQLAAYLTHRRAEVVVLDLTGVSFLGACGLTLLVEAREWAHAAGVALRVEPGTTRAVTRPLQATGLDQQLPLATTRADAFAASGPEPVGRGAATHQAGPAAPTRPARSAAELAV